MNEESIKKSLFVLAEWFWLESTDAKYFVTAISQWSAELAALLVLSDVTAMVTEQASIMRCYNAELIRVKELYAGELTRDLEQRGIDLLAMLRWCAEGLNIEKWPDGWYEWRAHAEKIGIARLIDLCEILKQFHVRHAHRRIRLEAAIARMKHGV